MVDIEINLDKTETMMVRPFKRKSVRWESHSKKTLFLLNFMTMNRAKSKKVANFTFPIVTNKVSTQESLSVIEAARQNVLATFPLKNNSNKLPLAASGSFFSPLAGSSFPVKVPSKRHTWISPSVVSTTSKSPKIFNNRPVNKLVFSALTTPTITSTTTVSQMAMKAKNSKKQQQAVATAMVTLNPFVVPDEIFGKISTAAASPLPNMDGNSSNISSKMGQDQPLAVLPDVVISSRLSPIPIAKQSINPDDLKDWADQMEMESTVPSPVSGAADGGAWENEYLNDATKVAISDEVFLTTLKIARSSGVASVSSPSLSVVLHNVPLGTSSNDIKTALGIFGVVTSVKLKPAGLWQYTVINFKDISSAAAVLSNWSVLVRKDSVRILPVANQKEVIFSKDAFKAKLVNLLFGCTAFEISDLVSQAAAFVVPPGAAAADMELNLGGSPETTTPVLSAVFSVPNTAVESRLTSLESHLSELSVLIKSLVESVGALVALVTKLLSTPSAMDVSMGWLSKIKAATVMQKRLTHLEIISERICLENGSDIDDMVDDVDDDDDDDDEDKDFSVYDNTFNVIMHLWEDQPSSIKSSSDQTAKWISSMVKNSHELISIMGKMYEFEMFDTLSSKGSTSM
ncbi:hypothetical protein G9A89_009724 [Geosiphon pyriformis]|nr:hypothetical protein G9A89_009724 [Geosiphon pyriformis]